MPTKNEQLLSAFRARLHTLNIDELLKLKRECQNKLFAGKTFLGNNLDVSLLAANAVNRRIAALKAEQEGVVPEAIDPVQHFSKVFGVDEAQAKKYIAKHGNPFPVQEGVRKPGFTAADLDYADDNQSEPEPHVERNTRRQHTWGE
jgi:hypothetical protein